MTQDIIKFDMDEVRKLRRQGRHYEANRMLECFHASKENVAKQTIQNIRTKDKLIRRHFRPNCKICGKKSGRDFGRDLYFCDDCRSERFQDIKTYCHENNKCVCCFYTDAREGKKVCQRCADNMRKKYYEKKAAGICVYCYTRKSVEGKIHCLECSSKRNKNG
jgi:hypothetical protein